MRRIRRSLTYEFTIDLNYGFMGLPRRSQRSWYLGSILQQAAKELEHLSSISADFLAGADSVALHEYRTRGHLDDAEIIADWQVPVMAGMADIKCSSQGDILEIGFGRGLAAGFIPACGVRSHAIIECKGGVVDRFCARRAGHGSEDMRLAHGLWQGELPKPGQFDGIFLHTCPLSDAEFVEQGVKCPTLAEHFFARAARHLRPGGVLIYLTIEVDALRRGHQQVKLPQFSAHLLSMLERLEILAGALGSHWVKQMPIAAAPK
jgi:guanidinoacetate N-methyltransferase